MINHTGIYTCQLFVSFPPAITNTLSVCLPSLKYGSSAVEVENSSHTRRNKRHFNLEPKLEWPWLFQIPYSYVEVTARDYISYKNSYKSVYLANTLWGSQVDMLQDRVEHGYRLQMMPDESLSFRTGEI